MIDVESGVQSTERARVVGEHWQRVEELYHSALALSATQRAAFLHEACAGDDVLYRDVESLLAHSSGASGFLDSPAIEVAANLVDDDGSLIGRQHDVYRVPGLPQILPGTRLGPYQIETLLGAGGMGGVFRARDTRLGRPVAIKVCLEAFSARFEREARSIAALNHPHVCTLYDIGPNYLVMELVEGETLAEVLQKGLLPLDKLLRYAVETADAVAAAHAEGIVHRDLKPANIMITAAGIKVLDFGVAKRAEPVDDDGATRTVSEQTRAGHIVGTLSYLSPEQAEGKTVDARSDVFSLGVVLYEMSCGTRPFRGDTTLSQLASILREAPEPPGTLRPELPKALERIILRCLEKKPEARFESARELHHELAASEIPGARSRISSRSVLAVAAVVLVIVAGVAGLQAYLRSSGARWAEKDALPEVARLVDGSRFLAAVALLRQAEPYIPDSPELIRLKANLPAGTVRISTMPDGADIYIRDYADTEPGDSPWRLLGRSPVQTDMVPQSYYPRGTYRVRAVKQGFETVEWAVLLGHIFQEVLTIELHATESTPAGMVWVPGITALGTSQTIPANAPDKTSAFWLDRNEVTNREFKEFVDKRGYEKREYWKEPFVKEGKALTWEQAMAEFRDPTGRRGPAAWQFGSYKEGEADFPVGGVSWYEAAAYAEFAGKSLPTVYHWYRAAAIGPVSDILNFSNFAGRGPARTEMYRGLGRFGNYDMAGNVQEWVSNAAGQLRYTLGGAWDTPKYQFGRGTSRCEGSVRAETHVRIPLRQIHITHPERTAGPGSIRGG